MLDFKHFIFLAYHDFCRIFGCRFRTSQIKKTHTLILNHRDIGAEKPIN